MNISDIKEIYLPKWKSHLNLISDFYQSSIGVISKIENGNSNVIQYHCLEKNINLYINQCFILDQIIEDHNLLSEDSFVLKVYDAEQSCGDIKFCSLILVPIYYPSKELFGHICLFDINKDAFCEKTVKLVFQTKELIENDISNIKKTDTKEISSSHFSDCNICKFLYEKSGAINSYFDINLDLSLYNKNFESIFLTHNKSVNNGKSNLYNDYYEIVLPHLKEVVNSKKSENFIDKIEFGKENLWLNSDYHPVFAENEDFLGVHIVANNITELIETKQKVLSKKQDLLEYERIFNLVANPICIVDINGVFIKTNPAFARILGYTSNEVEGHSMFEMIHPDDLQRSVNYISEKIKEQPDLLEFENRYVCKDGSSVWFSWMVQPIYEKGISYSVAHDITKLKQTEEELSKAKIRAEESDHLKTAFLCNMSHEIRTPMNGIVGFSDLLKSSAVENEELSYYCDIIRSSGQQLLRIVNDIIDISKIEIGEFEIINNKVNINDLINNTAAFYKPDIINKGLELQVSTPIHNNDAFFRCDETKLRQIFDNLISNALKFTEQGSISISYKLQDDIITISVEDTGIGIPEDKRENIFERFAQLKDPNKSYGGAGLGLAICKAYINKMGGDIWVDSIVDSGSKFFFTLPFTSSLNN